MKNNILNCNEPVLREPVLSLSRELLESERRRRNLVGQFVMQEEET